MHKVGKLYAEWLDGNLANENRRSQIVVTGKKSYREINARPELEHFRLYIFSSRYEFYSCVLTLAFEPQQLRAIHVHRMCAISSKRKICKLSIERKVYQWCSPTSQTPPVTQTLLHRTVVHNQLACVSIAKWCAHRMAICRHFACRAGHVKGSTKARFSSNSK